MEHSQPSPAPLSRSHEIEPIFSEERTAILRLAARLEISLIAGDKGKGGEALLELLQYVAEHFKTEEQIMVNNAYPALQSHLESHRYLRKSLHHLAGDLWVRSQTDSPEDSVSQMSAFIENSLCSHIDNDDKQLSLFLAELQPQIKQAEKTVKATITVAGRDVEYTLPEKMGHLLTRVDYVVPTLPPPQGGFDDLPSLLESAIERRIDKVLVFFQRNNPTTTREFPPIFPLSKRFSEKFRVMLRINILPKLLINERFLRLAAKSDWPSHNNETVWQLLDKRTRDSILSSWNAAWLDFHLTESKNPLGEKIYRIKDKTKRLREMLATTADDDYAMPLIRNREIEIFASFLDPHKDWWPSLCQIWEGCHDLYEQEFDPRIFQHKARTGALRDHLLAAFEKIPDLWADFLLLTCYQVFPRLTTDFLDNLSKSMGRDKISREKYLPYTMQFLEKARADPRLQDRENSEARQWSEQAKELRNYLLGREE
jgi:hemerythrin-like metal-binding protein